MTAGHHVYSTDAMPMCNSIGTFFRLIGFLVIASAANIFLISSHFLIKPCSRSIHHIFMSYFVPLFVSALTALLPSTNMHLYGDLPCISLSNRPVLLLFNHQTDIDWFYGWQVSQRLGFAGWVRFLIKKSLKHSPVFGWGPISLDFLALERNFIKDKAMMTKSIATLCEERLPLCFLMYPEGTTVQQTSQRLSHSFAEKTGRVQMKHLLSARSKGLCHILRKLAPYDPIVYDATMCYSGYSGEIPTLEMKYTRNIDKEIPSNSKLLSGTTCKSVHVCFRLLDVPSFFRKNYGSVQSTIGLSDASNVSTDPDYNDDIDAQAVKIVGEWIDEAWSRKDALLDEFIQQQTFCSEVCREAYVTKGSKLCMFMFLLIITAVVYSVYYANSHIYSCFWILMMTIDFFPQLVA